MPLDLRVKVRPSEPTEHDLAIEQLSRLARPIRGAGSSRRGESFNFSRQLITQTL